ncbi:MULTISPECIES: hypothetical protein [unclassified Caballeronia]|uniref:hypothetical protein n=1 Tax=unclassified Caballeronia TaxID=2646786 RepID=UPI0020292923|nr:MULTISPECIES: hypothetical protein [unclassified Caballeronia]
MKRFWVFFEASCATLALSLVVLFCVYAFRASSEGAAAWVQAIGSVAAIMASARLTRWQIAKQQKYDQDAERSLMKRRVKLVREVGEQAFSLINEIRVNIEAGDRAFTEYFARHFDQNHFEIVQSALSEIALWELPSPELILPVIVLRNAMARSLEAARELMESPRYAGATPRRIKQNEFLRKVQEQWGYAQNAMENIDTVEKSI